MVVVDARHEYQVSVEIVLHGILAPGVACCAVTVHKPVGTGSLPEVLQRRQNKAKTWWHEPGAVPASQSGDDKLKRSCCKATRLANTPASRSAQAPQLSPRAAPPALCHELKTIDVIQFNKRGALDSLHFVWRQAEKCFELCLSPLFLRLEPPFWAPTGAESAQTLPVGLDGAGQYGVGLDGVCPDSAGLVVMFQSSCRWS